VRGMARKKEKPIVVYTRFAPPLALKILKIAVEERRTMAAQIVVLVEKALEARQPEVSK
jgi:hypothetical protein